MARGLSICVLARRTCHVAHHGAIAGMWEYGVPRREAIFQPQGGGSCPRAACHVESQRRDLAAK